MRSCTRAAAAGRLHDPDVLAAQARRMLARRRASGGWPPSLPASGCTSTTSTRWTRKARAHFPTFAGLRGDMYEEAIRFFTDLFQHDASVLSIFDADHTFLNEPLAEHYGIPGVTGPEWRRVEGVRRLRPRRHPGPGGHVGQAVGRIAHQPDPARQLGVGSRCWAKNCPGRPRTCRGCPRTKRRPRG